MSCTLIIITLSVCVLSRVWLPVTPWAVAHQAPLSMGFSRQEYWSGLTFPSPGDLPNPGIAPVSLVSPALVGRFFTTGATDNKTVSCAHSETKLVGKWIEKQEQNLLYVNVVDNTLKKTGHILILFWLQGSFCMNEFPLPPCHIASFTFCVYILLL